MGDENSLQGRTQAHKHEASSSTGGFLSVGLTGMTNLANGSLIVGDASEIQTEIPAGNNLDVLTMGVSSPAWVAPSATTSAYELIATQTLAVATSSITITPTTPISWDDVASIRVYYSGSQTGGTNLIRMLLNGYNSAGNYYQAGDRNGSFYNQTNSFIELEGNANDEIYGYIDLYGENSLDAGNNHEIKFISHCTALNYYQNSYGRTTTGLPNPTFISCEFQSPATLEAGSTLSVYRINK